METVTTISKSFVL